MAQQVVVLGTGVNTPGTDDQFTAHTKHNANTSELYTRVAAVEASGGGSGGSTSVITATTDKTTSYTPVLADAGKMVEMNSASALIFTLPTNAAVAFPVGTFIHIRQKGAGQVTIAMSSGVTSETSFSRTTRVQHSVATVWKQSTTNWVVWGDLT